jgi:hypothetical protein
MDEGAAFGFFPQLRPRRRLQDPTASADVPVQGFRGSLSGLLGLIPDVANFMGRSPMPTETFGEFDYGPTQQLPYGSEYYLKELPLAPTSAVGQLVGQAASFAPLNPAPLVRGVSRGVQKLGTMVGQGMAERVATGRPMLPSLLAEPQSAMFAVEPNVPRMNLLDTPPETMTSLLEVKPQAPVSDLGFYSAAEQAALNLQRNKGSGQAFLNDLLKAENVKKDELQWMGVDDFLKEKPNVTKQEVQDFIANNRVDVKEVRLGEMPYEDPIGIAKRKEIFDKYEPEIQSLYKDLDNVTIAKRTAMKIANNKYDDMLLQLNKEGYMPTAQDYEAFNLAEKELTQAKRMQNDDIDIRNRLGYVQNIRDAEANAAYVIPEAVPTKYQRYQLPGGENYREILLTLPQKPQPLPEGFNVDAYSVNGVTKYGVYDASGQRYGSGATKDEALQRFSEMHQDKPYKSSHFDEPNILAHIRVNDRVDADGKKMLLIEEIQSDWHQAGREKGYKGQFKDLPNDYKVESKTDKDGYTYYEVLDPQGNVFAKDYSKGSVTNQAINRLNETVGGVPDAPFKDTWYQLALKRVLKHAADNGYERVGLTTGKQQAQRFDLSKQISKVMWDKETGRLTAYDKNVTGRRSDGRTVIDESGVTESKLSDYIGKEAAQKLIKESPDEEGVRFLSGLDLQVGGEGMKKYYDEIYPKFLDKYGKKWNARVGETQITTDYARDANGIPAQRPSKESIRYIDITPEMKGAVSKGQPLFAATPALPLGAQGLLGEPEKKKELSLLD